MVNGFWGRKVGMTQVFSDNKVVGVTVVDVSQWLVTALKTEKNDGYDAVQVGLLRKRYADKPFDKEWLKDLKTYFQEMREIKSSKALEDVVVGQPMSFHEAFQDGKAVDVMGYSKGSGFAGVMRRYDFSGGPNSHGSKLGRKPGSVAFMRTCGKVIKGKKMPGHMGVERNTIKGLRVVKVDKGNNVVLIKGAIPGKVGSVVFVRGEN